MNLRLGFGNTGYAQDFWDGMSRYSLQRAQDDHDSTQLVFIRLTRAGLASSWISALPASSFISLLTSRCLTQDQ